MVRIQGDGVLAVFGLPASGEDDGRRAVQAALDLHAEVRALPAGLREPGTPPLALHTGVHAGLVLVEAGDVERGRFELLGNAPNVAARLCAAAGHDEVLVSEETLGPEMHFFLTGARRQLGLKGRDEPLARRRGARPGGGAHALRGGRAARPGAAGRPPARARRAARRPARRAAGRGAR